MIRLGINIDHVATVRNARGCIHPDPLRAAIIAQSSGADGITAHLREDRRHISDEDIANIMGNINIPLNLEMAATYEMLEIARHHKPHAVCLVPEKREEKTTEGGLDIVKEYNFLSNYVKEIYDFGSRLSLFIDPCKEQIDAALLLNAPVIEIHTGSYCIAYGKGDKDKIDKEYDLLCKSIKYAHDKGLEVHAGHGITFDSVRKIAVIPNIKELNIGHFIIGEAIFTGLENSILKMRNLINSVSLDIS